MDIFKKVQDLSAIYDDDGPSSTVPESRPMFDKGGMAKLVSYVEGLPKGSTVTAQILQDYADKNNLDVNLKNFFNRNAKTIKNKTFISDTRSKDLKLTSEEKANIEKYGQEKYDKLTDKSDKLRVRKGQDVGSLALEKQQKVKFKKEYDKAIKYYKSKGIEEPNMDSIRKNIARNDGKFNATGSKLQSESGLTGLFKNYEKADLIADLKKGKNLSEISIEYFDKNEKQVLKMLEGKRDYSKPLGRLSTDLSNIISTDKEATKLYNKIKKQNSFNKLKNKSTYKKAVETLIPFAQEQGLIPNVNLKGKKINTASDYFNYAYKVKRDPIAKLFGFYERVGIEHPGGVARALIFDDAATLNEIVATMPDTNLAAGSTYDTYATGQARFFEKTKDPKYIKKINKIILNKQKEYGKPRTILDFDGDNVTRRTTKFSLTNPNLIEDSKSFINEYVAAGGSQRKNFNKLDPSLQKSILAFEEGDKIKGNKFLKTALKDTGAEADFKGILKKLEAHPGGCGKAAGGRILFAEGTPDGKITKCARRGVQAFMDDLKKGNYSKATLNILKGGGNLIKNIVNPMELLKLKNLIGPGAMGLMAAWEGGVITDDVIRKGTPLNESLANNWLTKAFLPYTKDYAKAKNLLETGKVPSNMKKYVQDVVTFNEMLMDMKGIEGRKDSRLVDDSFGMIDGTSMYTKEQEQKEDEALMKKAKTLTENVFTPGTAKALEMKSLQDENEATRMAKKEFSPIFGFDKLKDVRTPGSTSFDYIPEETPQDLRPITYKDYEKTELPAAERQYYENKLNIKPRSSLSEYSFPGSDINALEELTRRYNMREAAKYPGFFSADSEKFSEGGITTLRSKYEYKK
jgi:uncharacterized protein YdaU (DUF1376 family)